MAFVFVWERERERESLPWYRREILTDHQAKILLLIVYGLIAFVAEDIF